MIKNEDLEERIKDLEEINKQQRELIDKMNKKITMLKQDLKIQKAISTAYSDIFNNLDDKLKKDFNDELVGKISHNISKATIGFVRTKRC